MEGTFPVIRNVVVVTASIAVATALWAEPAEEQVAAPAEQRLAAPVAGSQEVESDAGQKAAGAAALGAGRGVHIDPATGRPTRHPTAAQREAVRAGLAALVNRSPAGLVETAGPRGGMMVDLQGRFRMGLALYLDDTGTSELECTAGLPLNPLASTDAEEVVGHE